MDPRQEEITATWASDELYQLIVNEMIEDAKDFLQNNEIAEERKIANLYHGYETLVAPSLNAAVKSKDLDLIKLMFGVGGEGLLWQTYNHGFFGPLHEACFKCAEEKGYSIEVIDYLIFVGGKKFIFIKDVNGYTALNLICKCGGPLELVERMLKIGGKDLVLQKDCWGNNCLEHVLACQGVPHKKDIMRRLINVGTVEVIRMAKSNPLHVLLCCRGTTIEEVECLVTSSGTNIVFEKHQYNGGNSLYLAFEHGGSLKIIQYLVKVGGKQMLQDKDSFGSNILHEACRRGTSLDVINYLLTVIDNPIDLLKQRDNDGLNPMHNICNNPNVSVEIVRLLVDEAGADIVSQKDNNGSTPLHNSCRCLTFYKAKEVIKYICDIGGRSLLIETDHSGELPIHWFARSFYRSFDTKDSNLEILNTLIQEGIRYQVGGEFGIGGLFEDIHIAAKSKTIFEALMSKPSITPEIFISAIERVVIGTPILHAAIKKKVSSKVIQNISTFYPWSLSIRDKTRNELPIQVAVRLGLKWDEGMKYIVESHRNNYTETTGSHRPRDLIHIGASFGMQWDCGMSDIVQNDNEQVVKIDPVTGLPPCVLAAAGEESHLETIHGLIQCRTDFFVEFIIKWIE